MGAMVSEGNSTNGTDADDGSRPPRLVFLALIMLLSCMVNLLLLYAIVQNKKARNNVQSIAVINLMAVCLGDSLLNMSLVMGSLAAGSDWVFSDALCKWHSFVMNLVLVETVLLLTVLTCDRYLVVKFPEKYDSYAVPTRLALVIVFTWIQALSFSVPFLFDTVDTTFRPKLHTCSVSDSTSLVFICAASVLCFLVPALIIIVMFVLIFSVSRKQQSIIAQNHYSDQLKEEPRLWREMATVKYVGVLCCLWFVLETPYIVTTYIQQYRLSSELSFSVDYPWGVDVAFIWMRFSFSALFPCVSFVCKKELWHSCKQCLICHRSNSVLDIKVTVDPTAKAVPGRKMPCSPNPPKSKDRDQPKHEAPSLLSFNVPVLFATSDGIHIETPQCDVPEADDADGDPRYHKPMGRQLDITDQMPDLQGDTSDYDSSTETEYSSSQPLSTRHIRGALEASSMPDLRQDEHHERGTPACSAAFTNSQGADSGLELNGTVGSAKGQRLQEQLNSTQEWKSLSNVNVENSHIDVKSIIPPDKKNGSIQTSNMSPYSEECIDPSHRKLPDNKDMDNAVGSNTVQHCAPSTLPKAHGRLKPLNPNRNIKTKKAKTDWPERKITMRYAAKKSEGADTKSKTSSQNNAVTETQVSRQKVPENPPDDKSSREGRGRGGHKRTVTSDSERALLSSDSSMELQNVKTRNFDLNSEKRIT